MGTQRREHFLLWARGGVVGRVGEAAEEGNVWAKPKMVAGGFQRLPSGVVQVSYLYLLSFESGHSAACRSEVVGSRGLEPPVFILPLTHGDLCFEGPHNFTKFFLELEWVIGNSL